MFTSSAFINISFNDNVETQYIKRTEIPFRKLVPKITAVVFQIFSRYWKIFVTCLILTHACYIFILSVHFKLTRDNISRNPSCKTVHARQTIDVLLKGDIIISIWLDNISYNCHYYRTVLYHYPTGSPRRDTWNYGNPRWSSCVRIEQLPS